MGCADASEADPSVLAIAMINPIMKCLIFAKRSLVLRQTVFKSIETEWNTIICRVIFKSATVHLRKRRVEWLLRARE